MQGELQILEGPRRGERFPVRAEGIVIGRDPGDGIDVALYDPRVSGRHARIEHDVALGGWVLEDLGSTNGTFVDEQAVTAPVLLLPGARITFGRVCASTFAATSSASAAPPPRAPIRPTAVPDDPPPNRVPPDLGDVREAVELLRVRVDDARSFLQTLHGVGTELERVVTAPPVEAQRTIRRLVGEGGSLSELERDLAEMLDAFAAAVRYLDEAVERAR
jgi:hypothetical protein